MTKQKRLPQISQISTDAFCSKVLCKSAESVGDYFFFPRNTRNSQNLQLVLSVSSVNSVGDYFSSHGTHGIHRTFSSSFL